jgi:hypothetical protein
MDLEQILNEINAKLEQIEAFSQLGTASAVDRTVLKQEIRALVITASELPTAPVSPE